jgi:adenylate cyclase
MDTNVAARTSRELLICFLDLSTYTLDARRTADDGRLAGIIDGYYERVAASTHAGGGTVVKFIGDGALLVFPPERADDAVTALLDLKAGTDAWLAGMGWESRLVVKAHAGPVVAGPFGARDDKRFDVLGDEVNVAARLQTRTLAISAQAFRLLSPDLRKRFKKHTPPITYIRVEERHLSNLAKG